MGISTAVQRCMSPVTKSHEVLSRTRSHEPPNTEASQFLSLALVQYTPSPVEVIQPTVFASVSRVGGCCIGFVRGFIPSLTWVCRVYGICHLP